MLNMTSVISFTFGSQSFFERSPETAEVPLITEKLYMVAAIYHGEEKSMSRCGCGTTKKKKTRATKKK